MLIPATSTLFFFVTTALCIYYAKKNKEKEFLGDCSTLSNKEYAVSTSWIITDEKVVAYPCSAGYAHNFAANPGFLQDLRRELESVGNSKDIKGNCANLCDIDNKSYVTVEAKGKVPLADGLKLPNVFCDKENGVLNSAGPPFNKGDNGDLNACRCDSENNYLAGCTKCEAVVTFKTKTCLASPAGSN